MIADSVFCVGPWQSEATMLAPSSPLFDLNLDCLNAELARARSNQERGFDLAQMDELLSVESSVASSECSVDDLYIETETITESDNLFSLCETLGSPLLGAMDELLDKQASDMSWGEGEHNTSLEHVTNRNSNVTMTSLTGLSTSLTNAERTELNTVLDNSPPNTWSGLSGSDKIGIVQDLTDIISTQLGLREQLEVIRIINPTAAINPLDTEFAIDLEDLNSEKVEQIRKYIQQHQHNLDNDLERSERPASRSSTPVSDSCSECLTSPPKKRMSKKQRNEQQKLERQRRKKEMRQIMKEKRSGLFRSEQVLSLSKHNDSHNASEEEVDIIT